MDFKQKMKEKIKEYSNEKYLQGYIKDEYNIDDKDADIYLQVYSKNELFDSRTVGKQKSLTDKLYSYIEAKTDMLDNDVPINLHIIGYAFPSKDQEEIKHLIKEHYSIELYKAQKEYKKVLNKAMYLLLAGLLFLLIYLAVIIFVESNVSSEIFAFLFTYSLWEALHGIIYVLSKVKDKRAAITQNLLMEVDFNDKDGVLKNKIAISPTGEDEQFAINYK